MFYIMFAVICIGFGLKAAVTAGMGALRRA
jgi:hypothetical protein